ncbi:SDR family oxidoreductase [Azohydromonas lata]|uniref:SDR family oxidoreductase n=1 Tax=Azohydromonas lata TaxID=45677 RepID=A0ABU5II21_9BURK|nr:SDR family oxidoreductase [Azohydromonas lata]MDZ5458786.1 SDR family oxidoreductase [Azohydromonas lata]
MKVVIIGGSGLIGKHLAALLRQAGHEVTAASPSTGVNAVTAQGLPQALAGAEVVVDVSNSPSFESGAVLAFFESSTRNLLACEAQAGVRHHVALSVVGSDRLPANGYLRAKVAQESLISNGKVPFTIVRATQFFEFLKPIADTSTSGQAVRVSSATLQPIAALDVARALAEVVSQPPLNGLCEVAGPQAIPLDELVRRVLRAAKDTREVLTDDDAPYFGARLSDESLTPGPGARIAATSLERWLADQAATA